MPTQSTVRSCEPEGWGVGVGSCFMSCLSSRSPADRGIATTEVLVALPGRGRLELHSGLCLLQPTQDRGLCLSLVTHDPTFLWTSQRTALFQGSHNSHTLTIVSAGFPVWLFFYHTDVDVSVHFEHRWHSAADLMRTEANQSHTLPRST